LATERLRRGLGSGKKTCSLATLNHREKRKKTTEGKKGKEGRKETRSNIRQKPPDTIPKNGLGGKKKR